MSSAPTGSERLTYVDSSAFVKLAVHEAESDALREHLRAGRSRLAASALLEVEVTRAARAAYQESVAVIDSLLESVLLIEVSAAIRRLARSLEPTRLRALDAIHLATAIEIGAHSMLVYDRRLGEAAAAHGVVVLSPGA